MGSGFRMLLWVILVIFFTVSVSGAEFHVSTANDLTSALKAAATNGEDDTIELVASTYQGNFSYQPGDGKDLTLRGVAETTPEEVILDGGGKGTVLFFVASSHGGSVTLAGITLQNGKVQGDYGGGIKVVGQDGRLKLSLKDVIIEHNSAGYHGGGIGIKTYGNASVKVEIRDSVIRYNETPGAANGGQGRGGGIFIYAYRGNSSIELLMVNSLIHGNQANWTGGGIELDASEVGVGNIIHAVLINTTITGNVANMNERGHYPGGGIVLYGYRGEGARATLDLYNSIVWGNTATAGVQGQDIYIGAADPAQAEVHAYHCDLGDVLVDASSGSPVYGVIEGIAANPLFLSPEDGDFQLGEGSPCIDAGTSDITASGLPEMDISGNPRICGPAPDLGPYERCVD